MLFLDKRNQIIADEVQQTGTVDHTPVYPREVVKRALELCATAIILVHNHPSGDPTPSPRRHPDDAVDRRDRQAARHFGARPHHRRQGRPRQLQGAEADLGRGAEGVTSRSALTILVRMTSPIRATRGLSSPWFALAAKAALAGALVLASALWDGGPFFVGAQIGAHAQAALTNAQAEALDTYNKALDEFRSILKERRAQIDQNQPLPELPGQAIYLARNNMISAYKDLTDVHSRQDRKAEQIWHAACLFRCRQRAADGRVSRAVHGDAGAARPMRRNRTRLSTT